MKTKLYKYLSLGTLILGAVAGGYALLKTHVLKASLPAGTYPVLHSRPLLYIGISLCLVSFIFSLMEQRAKKREKLTKAFFTPYI